MESESSKNLLRKEGAQSDTDDYSLNSKSPSPMHSGIESLDEDEMESEEGVEVDEDIFEHVQMILRKRRDWGTEDKIGNNIDLLEDDDILVEEDDGGCPLPSTPEDNELIEAEVNSKVFKP